MPPPRVAVSIDANATAASEASVQATTTTAGVEGTAVGTQVEGAAEASTNIEVAAETPLYSEPVPLVGSEVVEFFGVPLEGVQDVVFVLDRSGSMEELALGQLAELVPAPAPEVDASGALPVGPVDHDDMVPPTTPVPSPAPIPESAVPVEPAPPPVQGPRKIDVAHVELVDALSRLPAGTRMNVLFFNERFEAVEASLTPLDDRSREDAIGFVWQTVPAGATALAPAMRTAYLMNARRIVLLSDGLGNVGGDVAAVLRDAREAIRGGVRIDTIGLGRDQDIWLLRSLAAESGGIYQQL